MKKPTLALFGLLAALCGAIPAAAQTQFPTTLPANTVWGRTGISPGPGQAIPFNVFFGNMFLGASGDFTCTSAGVCTIGAAAVSNSKLANMAADTVKCNNTGSSAAPIDCTTIALVNASTAQPSNILSIANGGANPLSPPNQVSPFAFAVATAGAYADSSSAGLGAQFSSWFINSGSRPIVAVFGEGRGDGASSSVWGSNFVGYANASGATARATELDFGALVSGGVAFGNIIVNTGTSPTSGAYLQLQTNSTTAANGIVVNGGGGQPIASAGTIFGTSGAISVTKGIDFTSATFSGSAFASTGFSVDGSGNVTGANVSANALFDPIVIGGNTASSTLTLRSANAVGTTDAIIFQVGNSGGTESYRVLDSGVLKMGTPSFTANGTVATSLTSLGPTGSHTTVQEWLTVQDSAGNVRWIPAF